MSRTPTRILQADPSDAPQSARLLGKTYSETYGQYLGPDRLKGYLSTKLSPECIERQIRDPTSFFLIAITDPISSEPKDQAFFSETGTTDVVGVLELRDKSPHESVQLSKPLCVNRCYVMSEAQGTGVASAMIRRGEEEAKRRGYDGLWLHVWDDNGRAKRFYEKQGFVWTGAKQMGEMGGLGILMQKTL